MLPNTTSSTSTASTPSFNSLALAQPILNALADVGYETPSPIQSQTIPHLLEGRDVLGQAQTGTGKTAAFALPLLSQINLQDRNAQVLVLTPTRELAIQVADSFKRYASFLKGFEVLPIYGGQDYGGQIKQLKKGVHVIVGTPGRLMDHMRRGTLKLDNLSTVVLDEADEMLRMGFIDDVEWILEQTPSQRQIALFSATMPTAIRRIAQKYLNKPEEITIKASANAVESIRQRVLVMHGINKFDALSRILEVEPFDGMIIFVRTKNNTVELAEDLKRQGHSVAALNGDIPQNQRERTVDQLKQGRLNILVATDVVARGLDVERISHVINYDIPFNTEAYVHRIGRTGRAGRTGDAILFVNPRERHLLRDIERTTKKKIDNMELPSVKQINEQRVQAFQKTVTESMTHKDTAFFREMLQGLQEENNISMEDIAASLAVMLHKNTPLLLTEKFNAPKKSFDHSEKRQGSPNPKRMRASASGTPNKGMLRYRMEVGKSNGVKPGNIVGAIANEAGIESEFIQQVSIHDSYSTVDLPEGMPKNVFRDLLKTWVCGKQLNITLMNEAGSPSESIKPKVKKSFKRKTTH